MQTISLSKNEIKIIKDLIKAKYEFERCMITHFDESVITELYKSVKELQDLNEKFREL
jgi:hypothetical protein